MAGGISRASACRCRWSLIGAIAVPATNISVDASVESLIHSERIPLVTPLPSDAASSSAAPSSFFLLRSRELDLTIPHADEVLRWIDGVFRRAAAFRGHVTQCRESLDKALIQGRCNELRKQIAETKSDYDREKLEERLAKLAGGVAVIRVGAHSEAELKSRREAFDDAIHATKAAVAEGIVAGGGVALLRAVPMVASAEAEATGDEKIGLRILRLALEAPARQIGENSGVDGGVVVEKIRTASARTGFDAAIGEYVDMFERGIIDPLKK